MQNVVTFFCHRISTSDFRNFGIAAIQFPQRDKLTHQHKCKITLQSVVVHAHDQFILHEPKTRKFFQIPKVNLICNFSGLYFSTTMIFQLSTTQKINNDLLALLFLSTTTIASLTTSLSGKNALSEVARRRSGERAKSRGKCKSIARRRPRIRCSPKLS